MKEVTEHGMRWDESVSAHHSKSEIFQNFLENDKSIFQQTKHPVVQHINCGWHLAIFSTTTTTIPTLTTTITITIIIIYEWKSKRKFCVKTLRLFKWTNREGERKKTKAEMKEMKQDKVTCGWKFL